MKAIETKNVPRVENRWCSEVVSLGIWFKVQFLIYSWTKATGIAKCERLRENIYIL